MPILAFVYSDDRTGLKLCNVCLNIIADLQIIAATQCAHMHHGPAFVDLG